MKLRFHSIIENPQLFCILLTLKSKGTVRKKEKKEEKNIFLPGSPVTELPECWRRVNELLGSAPDFVSWCSDFLGVDPNHGANLLGNLNAFFPGNQFWDLNLFLLANSLRSHVAVFFWFGNYDSLCDRVADWVRLHDGALLRSTDLLGHLPTVSHRHDLSGFHVHDLTLLGTDSFTVAPVIVTNFLLYIFTLWDLLIYFSLHVHSVTD